MELCACGMEKPVLYTLRGHSAAINSVDISADGCSIASGSFDGTVRLWMADQSLDPKNDKRDVKDEDEMMKRRDGKVRWNCLWQSHPTSALELHDVNITNVTGLDGLEGLFKK